MPSSTARATACSWSAAAPLIISPPTAPQPKPSSDTSRPVLPNFRLFTAASRACLCRRIRSPARRACQLSGNDGALAARISANSGWGRDEMTNADPALIEDVVAANRILFDQGVVDGFGHISARHDKDPQRFLLARSMAPGLVTAADIMAFDLDGNPI